MLPSICDEVNMFKSIAIDGPAGAGKSDVSDILANKLSFIHVDTGALYRTIAFYFKDRKNSLNEAYVCSKLKNVFIDIKFDNNKQKMFLSGIDVSGSLRSDEISNIAAKISQFKCVRNFLLPVQRRIAESNNVVMDGRDIATVVLPSADVKFFLTASLEERAMRRFKQLRSKNIECHYDEILSSIKVRDSNDLDRANSPLEVSKDAIFFDTTGKTIAEVTEFLIIEIKKVIN